MQKKFLFIIFLISDIASAYKLLEGFPNSISRFFGFALCLFFINALLIFWTRYLVRQPEDVQKEIKLLVAEENGVVTRSLYEILHNSWTKMRRMQFLYGETAFSIFVLVLIIHLFGTSFATNGIDQLLFDIGGAFSLHLLPYYFGFCLSSIMTIVLALAQNKKNDVIGSLRKEFVIKVIQTVFISSMYEAGGPVLLFVALVSLLRGFSRKAS